MGTVPVLMVEAAIKMRKAAIRIGTAAIPGCGALLRMRGSPIPGCAPQIRIAVFPLGIAVLRLGIGVLPTWTGKTPAQWKSVRSTAGGMPDAEATAALLIWIAPDRKGTASGRVASTRCRRGVTKLLSAPLIKKRL